MREAAALPGVEAFCGGLLRPDLRNLPEQIDGIAGSFNQADIAIASKLGLPILTFNDVRKPGIAQIITNREILARELLDFIMMRGGRELAFYFDDSEIFASVKPVFEAVESEARARGIVPIDIPRTGPRLNRAAQWNLRDQLADLTERLHRLRRYTTVFAVDDWHANCVVFAAKAAGIAIPRQIAVVGLGNEAIYCESIRPTITSIMIEQEAKGARAARLLVDIIRGAASPDTVIKIPPRGIVARESTGFGQPEDPQLERAFDSMKNWSGEMPDLSEVAANAGMSLRTLHRKVSNATGKSPAAILHILRLEKAFALLRETGLSLAEVADLAGYSLPSQLSREVKQHTGQTASAYRARWQQG